MYQKILKQPDATDTALIEAALALVARSGFEGATSRAIANAAGVSASSIAHRFGSQKNLLDLAIAEALRRHVQAWSRRSEQLGAMALGDSDLPAALHMLARACGDDREESTCVFWVNLLRDDDGELGEAMDWLTAVSDGCAQLPVLDQLTLDERSLLAMQLFNLSRGLLIAPRAEAFEPWLRQVCDRFAARLAGEKPRRLGDSAWRQAIEEGAVGHSAQAADTDSAKHRIVQACAELLEKGRPERINHRTIAARAGVSLSSTTHHFESLGDILTAGCRELVRKGRESAQKDLPLPDELSLEQILEAIPELIAGTNTPYREQNNLVQNTMWTASRFETARPAILALHVQVGETSTKMLGRIRDIVPTDRIDGHIQSQLVVSAFLLARIDRAPDAPARIASALQALIRRMFQPR